MKYIFKKYWKYMLVICIGILSFIGMYIYSSYNKNNDVETNVNIKRSVTKSEEKEENNKIKTVFVDVAGAVNNPGVYEIEEGKRIIHAINLAGGLSNDANTININLSRKVEDEMYIIVYTKNEIYNYKKNNGSDSNIKCASNECLCPDSNNDACVVKEVKNVSKDEQSISNGKVSINTASKEQLMTLSGVGEAKANAIITYRNENGGFKNIEDIKNVSGIGDALFEKIKDSITL